MVDVKMQQAEWTSRVRIARWVWGGDIVSPKCFMNAVCAESLK